MVVVGAVYEHYKGKKYKIIGIATHTETLEECVVYQALYYDEKFGNHAVWVRPLTMFTESVIIDGVQKPRFKACTL